MRRPTASSKPSSPRWFLFPGPSGRGFLSRFQVSARRACVVAIAPILAACSGVDIDAYANNTPTLVPEAFFAGNLTAHGVVKNRSGEVIRRFNADIKGCWKDGVGILDEEFLFDDGEEQSRIWKLVPSGSNTFTATAGDVVGPGEAQYAGNSMFLKYVLRVPLDDDTIDLTIDDRMYLINDRVLINESAMEKFGVQVGQILLTIIKQDDEAVTCRQG